MRTGSKSLQITPADGEAFFTSAINATSPALGRRRNPRKSRRGPWARTASCRSAGVMSGTGSRPTSTFFCATMVSRIFKRRLFLFVFDALHALERTTCPQPRIHKRIQIAVHHRLHIARFHGGAEIFHHAIWLEDITANLVA